MKAYFLFPVLLFTISGFAQNVGIGTTTPLERLHVIHTADVNKNTIYGYASQTSAVITDYQNTGVTGFGQGNGTANGFGYGFGVKGIGSTNSWGAIGVYAGLATSVPNLSFNNNFYALYADAGTAAANRHAAVFLNGNVGINNISPAYKLDINGDINIGTGLLRVNGNPGTSGQVLTSNGSSDPTWQAVTSTPQVGFYAILNSDISVSGPTTLTSYAEVFDDGNNFNNATGVFTAPSTGLYQFNFDMNWISPISGNVQVLCTIWVAGVAQSQARAIFPAVSGWNHSMSHTFLVKLTPGIQVYLEVSQLSGTITLNGGAGSPTSFFSCTKVY